MSLQGTIRENLEKTVMICKIYFSDGVRRAR